MKIKILRTFSKINFAIILLLFIASFSIMGTIIEQDQDINFYIKNYSNYYLLKNLISWKLILIFELNHIYRAWWFLLLLFLFGLTLISCTITQQFPVLKFARQCNFKLNLTNFQYFDYYTSLKQAFFFKCLNALKNKEYNIFYQKNLIYSYKGILGRFAPIIVHSAMLIILIGNTITALTNFNSQELIVKNEIFEIQNLISKNFMTKIPTYKTRINDFWILYDKNNIKQFYSDLSILENNGREIIRKTISVNLPLQFKNLTFYQTDWNLIGLRLRLNKKIYQLPLVNFLNNKNIWIAWIPFSNSDFKGLTLITNHFSNKFFLYDTEGNILGNFNFGDRNLIKKKLIVLEIIPETGLQIKKDLGIPLIYFGFGILMLSSIISYLSFTQFWFSKKIKFFLIGATSNRAKLDLGFEFLIIALLYSKKFKKF